MKYTNGDIILENGKMGKKMDKELTSLTQQV